MLRSVRRWKGGEGSLKDFKAEAEGLFDNDAMKELAGMLDVSEPAKVAAFRDDLIEHCAHYREVISTLPCDLNDAGAPFNMTLTKRADWFETDVIKPCEKLLAAISEGNKPMYSTWPYPLTVSEFRDNSALKAELSDMLNHAKQRRDHLRGQQAEGAGHSQELRQEVFCSMARTFRKHAPHIPPNRGVYDAECRQRYGSYVDAMRLVFNIIMGVIENLDRLIRAEMDMPS